jgi:sialic acid synthase SpsE
MACAHDGELDKAEAIVDAAVEAGADAVQFEILDPDDNIVPDTDMYRLLQRLYFSPEQWRKLFNYTRQYDIAIFSYAYDFVSLVLALELNSDAIKLNSSDLSNPDMIIKIAESRLPFTVGTGASTMHEVARSLELALAHGGDKLILMHGVQNFPTDLRYAHIRRVQLLRSAFDCLVGYADHTEGGTYLSQMIDLVAVGMGAVIIEKHITLDRSAKGIDYEAALEPDEYERFVETIHAASSALGPRRIQPLNQSDLKYRRFQKKSIVAASLIPQGTEITREKVAFLRNSTSPGLSPSELAHLLGKEAQRNIEKFEQIQLADVID